MAKKVIAIVSVLKPVDDVRNFKKLAGSLGNTNKYEINIIGFSAINIPQVSDIHFFPLFNFKRSSLARLGASWKIQKILLKVKPELIIVTTSELLIVSILNKILFGTKIIYDVQENYFKNIVHTDTYPKLVRYPFALAVRLTELVCSPFIDHFISAEKIYQKQMKFIRKKCIVLENKALHTSINTSAKNNDTGLKLVYSGTIAEHYGIFDCIDFVQQLRNKDINAELTIIGFASSYKIYKKLKSKIRRLDFIKLVGGNTLVPHDQILTEMDYADFCLLPYRPNKSTEGRIPTKLFECLAAENPVIISPGHSWNELIVKNNAGIIHDFQSPVNPLIDKLSGRFYGKGLAEQYLWNNSEGLLQSFVSALI